MLTMTTEIDMDDTDRLIWAAVEEWRPLLEQYAEIARLCELVRLVMEPLDGVSTTATDRTIQINGRGTISRL